MSCSTLPHDCSVSMQLSPMERGAGESPRAPIVAFALFRFEWDDEEEPEYPVLYCYELQIRSTFQGRGLGRNLMDVLKVTAAKLKMESATDVLFMQ